MTSFIHDVLVHLLKQHADIAQFTFVLPSKRAGIFLKHELSRITTRPVFSPQILSIEAFVEELAQLKPLSNTELLFEFYDVYTAHTPEADREPFDSFSKWAQIILQDFNEIDRFLVPQKHIFDYLSAIQDINHWSLTGNQTPLIQNYLSFWNKLHTYYTALGKALTAKGAGYQGLLYREAVENLQNYIQSSKTQHIFLGFNALNTAEATIIQELLQNDRAEIYWDTDRHFIENPIHDAGLFLRQYQKSWPYFKTRPFHWISDSYKQNKAISVIGIPRQVGQAKYIGELLQQLRHNNPGLSKTALILGDENLLLPVLSAIPKDITALNITMGFPLRAIPLAALFEQLFLMHKNTTSSFYYKDVVAVLSHESIRPLFQYEDQNYSERIIETIQQQNLTFITASRLSALAPEHESLVQLLFGDWANTPDTAFKQCTQLIYHIKAHLDQNKAENVLALEYAYRFHEVFNVLQQMNAQYRYINSITILHSLFKEVLSAESLDFQGEPLDGLQVMGMLESRVLDFETVILSSVNEGILPAGKRTNSFIPFDVKLENGLPTYKEKDAVYTYHFYRLLQRAKNIYLIYNTDTDVLMGGEKSRFITQLDTENIHPVFYQLVSPITPQIEDIPMEVSKSAALMSQLETVALKGFSPSSLATYIRNPMDFYSQRILGIREQDQVEETVAANTLGTVIHNTLEDLYKPLQGQFLTASQLSEMNSRIDPIILHHFSDIYKEGQIKRGKNLIIYEIAKRYIANFIAMEMETLKQGNTIRILQIETDVKVSISLPEIDFPVYLTGKVDRVDEFNGVQRIIDYKTGKVEQSKVEIVDWDSITTDYDKYSKSFQLLMYAYMIHRQTPFTVPVEAGIISFKNLKAGVLKFATKPSPGSRNKDTQITSNTLSAFETQLKRLILEICNPSIAFTEKEV